MGYEVRLIAGRTSSITLSHDKVEPKWLRSLLEIELNKMLGITSELEKFESEEVYIYRLDDGDTEVTEDRYGTTLKAYKLEDIIQILQYYVNHFEYLYLNHAITCLRSIRDLYSSVDIKVIPFGH